MKRTISQFITVVMLSLAIMACSGPSATSETDRFAGPRPTGTASVTATAEQAAESDDGRTPTVTSDNADTGGTDTPTQVVEEEATASQSPEGSDPTATEAPATEPTSTPMSELGPGNSLFPDHRILSFYGHPSTPIMGILGAHSKEDLLVKLQEQAAEYEAADPDTPVILAFELIATVAQPEPGDDGTYLLYTGDEWIGEYVDFAVENDMLVILDLQIGHDTIPNEINKVRHWLKHPNVHVALDPEFSTGPNEFLPGRAPGTFIGEVDGHDVQVAMEMLSEIAQENDLPNKVLVVHQFESEMIYNKDVIAPVPNVDFVLDMDGFGAPEAKIGNYNVFVRQELIQWGGIKLFYEQDVGLIDPATIVDLKPPPMVVIYQ